ncbi:hypothetical protein GCM10011578_070630 [Streptomyces fuscichromogenes]|uniref:Uncharacterized protein n=1 Tax=Streptomyces fuscichromogenes TaxID=1324013 RepID=A0A918CVA8_9ACTN|nr:hypothetical protein GCM10011578_070630 [Streptomyces fuscichromogenes]
MLLAQLSDEELAEVRERAAHVNEVLTGFRSGSDELAEPGEPRPQYAATVPKLQRYEAKAIELGVSVRTIKRWVRAFLTDREAGLVRGGPERRSGDMGGLGRADPRWVEMALEILAEHGKDSKPTRGKVIRSVGPRLEARHGEGEVKLPGRATAYRWLQELERRLPTFRLSTKRNRDIAARPPGAYGKLRPTRPGEYLLMDTTRLDVFAMDPITMKWVQAELTVAMDWYDRCVTGLRVTPVSTSSIDVAAVMFQTFRPRPAGKDWPAHAVWPDHGIPRTVFVERKALEPGEEEPEKAKKHGVASPALVPETIVVDHGKPYISEHITSVCQRLGLSIQPARLRTGRDKGPLERFFKTVREGVLEVLPGYKGPDLFSRGERPEDQAFFFLHELEAIIREWVACVYHLRPHRGLVDAHVPGLNLSPAAMFEHGIARAGYIEVPRDPALGFEFLKTEWKPTHHYGVEIRKCRYNGPGLGGYRGETSEYTGPKAKGLWPVQVDPDNINYIYFRRPDTRRWHTLQWEHTPAQKFPISQRHGTRLRRADGTSCPAELLDRDWLHAQYVDRHRSFKDIGQELGVTPGTVARWARHHHIPRQSNRHLSRPALGIEYIPAVLQPALNNNYQLRRLRTFFQIAGYRSLGDACAALGLSSHSVTNHLARLEEDMGGPLLVRTQRSRPMEPTALGHQVLDAARPLSDQLGVPTTAVPAKPIPPSRRGRPRTTAAAATRLAHLPALLRPAAGSYGGRLRLRRFLEAVQYPNLAAFARAEGLDPSTVTLQISRLERDFDGRLLDRGGPGHAMRLTGLGKRVVAAAQPYRDQLGDLHGPRHRPKPPQQLTDDLT